MLALSLLAKYNTGGWPELRLPYLSSAELALKFLDPGGFLMRRLHSLTGVVPVGAFLINHFIANSFAVRGAESYNHHVEFLRGLPYLYLVEVGLIGIPILFHGLLGLLIVLNGEVNVGSQNRFRNWMYVVQRASGVLLVAFIAVHVWTTRFSGEENLYALMQHKLANPLWFWFYVLGVLSATFHFANGMWGFCVTWGITLSERSQQMSTWLFAGVFVLLSLAGINSLLAFTGTAIQYFNPGLPG